MSSEFLKRKETPEMLQNTILILFLKRDYIKKISVSSVEKGIERLSRMLLA